MRWDGNTYPSLPCALGPQLWFTHTPIPPPKRIALTQGCTRGLGYPGWGSEAGGSTPRGRGRTCSRPRRGPVGQKRGVAPIPGPAALRKGSEGCGQGLPDCLLPRNTSILPTLFPHSGPNLSIPHTARREYSFPSAFWKSLGWGTSHRRCPGSSPPPHTQLAQPSQPRPPPGRPGRLGHEGARPCPVVGL